MLDRKGLRERADKRVSLSEVMKPSIYHLHPVTLGFTSSAQPTVQDRYMKRIFPLIAIGIIAALAISDIKLLLRCLQDPNTYSAMMGVSFVHYMILHEWSVQFAEFKLAMSGLLFAIWLWKLIKPFTAKWVVTLTSVYALLWASFGLLVLTGIVGLLQHVAEVPIRYFDFTLLVSGMGSRGVALLVAGSVVMPLLLLLLPTLDGYVHRGGRSYNN